MRTGYFIVVTMNCLYLTIVFAFVDNNEKEFFSAIMLSADIRVFAITFNFKLDPSSLKSHEVTLLSYYHAKYSHW